RQECLQQDGQLGNRTCRANGVIETLPSLSPFLCGRGDVPAQTPRHADIVQLLVVLGGFEQELRPFPRVFPIANAAHVVGMPDAVETREAGSLSETTCGLVEVPG